MYGGSKMLYNFYCITNTHNNKKYIGLTKREISVRFLEHVRCAMNDHDIKNSYFMPILNTIRKYGPEKFKIELLERCYFTHFSDAEEREGFYIKKYKSLLSENGYNLNFVENGIRKYVEVIKEKIITNNSGKNNPFYGKKHSEDTKKVISTKAKQRFSNPQNNPRYGYRFTEKEKEESRKRHLKYAKPFYGDGVYYTSLSEASRKLNLTKQALSHRLKSKNYSEWFYIDQGEKNVIA